MHTSQPLPSTLRLLQNPSEIMQQQYTEGRGWLAKLAVHIRIVEDAYGVFNIIMFANDTVCPFVNISNLSVCIWVHAKMAGVVCPGSAMYSSL